MPRSLTLQFSREKNCIEITQGIQTTLFQDGIRGIPFKNHEGIVTKTKSVLFSSQNKPKVDTYGYVHAVFYDPVSDTLSTPLIEKGNFLLLLLKNVVYFKVTPMHGIVIRNATNCDGTRDVLLMSSEGGRVVWGYKRHQEVEFRLQV
jgi:hypothetical protein